MNEFQRNLYFATFTRLLEQHGSQALASRDAQAAVAEAVRFFTPPCRWCERIAKWFGA